jgi:hypothetical protein
VPAGSYDAFLNSFSRTTRSCIAIPDSVFKLAIILRQPLQDDVRAKGLTEAEVI